MHLIIPALLVSTLVPGGLCQQIMFENFTLITPCTRDARIGMDRFLIYGTLGDNVTEHLAQNWHNQAFVISRLRYHGLVNMCTLTIQGTTCVGTDICPCFYNTSTDEVHFLVNQTIIEELNHGVISVEWPHVNKSKIYANKNYTMEGFYDVNAANLTLTIYGMVGKLDTAGACNFSVTLNRSNHLKLCCSNMAMPCYPQISFDGTVLGSNISPCVNYTSAFDGVAGNLTLSYSVCSKTDYASRGFCRVIAAAVTTTTERSSQSTGDTTTASELSSPAPSSTANTRFMTTTSRGRETRADGAEEKSCLLYFCDLYLAFGLLFLELLGGVAYAIIWCIFFKKDEDGTTRLDKLQQKSGSLLASGGKVPSRSTLERNVSKLRGKSSMYSSTDQRGSTAV